MSNIEVSQVTTEEAVTHLVGLPIEDFYLALSKIKDAKVIREAYIKTYMRDRTDMSKAILAHGKKLGLTIEL